MINEYETTEEFIPKVLEVVNGKLFEHYILLNTIFMINYQGAEYLESYIIGTPESWILGFCIQDTYLIYGHNWTKEQLDEVQTKVNSLKYIKPFHFSGTAELIKSLTLKFDVKIFKDRNFYENKIVSNFDDDSRCSLAKNEDIEAVSNMMCDYFEDEYDGKNNKQLEQMRIEVQDSIKNGSIWILKIENKIVSMCSIILTQFDSPIIGSFFTDRSSRNKGYGTKLLSHVSKKMIERFGIVTLLADKNHLASIRVFEKLNYKNIYQTLEVAIKQNIS